MNQNTQNDKNTPVTPAKPDAPIGAGVVHDDKNKTATMTPPAAQPVHTDAKPGHPVPNTPSTLKV